MLLRQCVALSLLALVSGCNHLKAAMTEVPPPLPEVSATCSEATGSQQELCDTITGIRNQANLYSAQYALNTDNRVAIQSLTLASALAGSGFLLFDAHADNLKAAGLATGAFTLIDNGFRFNDRTDVARDAVLSLGCLVLVGNTFVSGFAGDHDDIVDTSQELANQLALGREYAAKPLGAGASAQSDRIALNDAIKKGDVALAELLKSKRAFSRADTETSAGALSIDGLIAKRMAGLRPDLAALVKEAQGLEKSLQTSEPTAGGSAADGQAAQMARRGGAAAITDASITNELNILLGTAFLLDAEKYINAFTQLGACRAVAAS